MSSVCELLGWPRELVKSVFAENELCEITKNYVFIFRPGIDPAKLRSQGSMSLIGVDLESNRMT